MASSRLLLLLGSLAFSSTACGEDPSTPLGPSGAGGANTGGNPSGQAGSSGSATTAGSAGLSNTAGGSSGTAGAGGSGGTAGSGTAGSGTAGSGTAGSGGNAGTAGSGGNAGTAGAGGDSGQIPLNNPPVKSMGCDKAPMLTSGEKTIMSGNRERRYTIDIPASYDMTKPYRVIYASHWIGSEDEAVVGQGYYHLKPKATADNVPVIFIAPQAGPNDSTGTWSSNTNVDHIFFDDILAQVKQGLCVDTTRVFAIGFSFGGMQTWSLSVNHQKDLRAAVGIAPANWNIYVPPKTHESIPWMQTTGMSDGTCKWVNNDGRKEGAKYIALEHAADNGCTVPAELPTWKQGEFFCFDFEGCKPGYPTKACTFDGGHVSTDAEPWIATEAWKFFKQF